LTVLVRHRRSVRTLLRSPSWLQGEWNHDRGSIA
jgi:hypothetical protein